jgi:hypothetical protein
MQNAEGKRLVDLPKVSVHTSVLPHVLMSF